MSWLLNNYIIKGSFFNYNVISDNFFALSITTVLMIMLGGLSFVMWGVNDFNLERRLYLTEELT